MGVLLGIVVVAVTVLTVHPQVGDRGGGEHPADMGVHPFGQVSRDAGRGRQHRRFAGVCVERSQRGGAPVVGEGRPHLVGRHITGVDGLSDTWFTGKARGQVGIDPGQGSGQRGGHVIRQRGHVCECRARAIGTHP